LKDFAKEFNVPQYYKMKKEELLNGFKLMLQSFKEKFEDKN
jgi:hypothetical protein